jgi:hypothetical protein
VWHASVSGRLTFDAPVLLAQAQKALHGVGDAQLGEWMERPGRVLHLRRRLTAHEMRTAGIDGPRDIRGTAEEEKRLAKVMPYIPEGMRLGG